MKRKILALLLCFVLAFAVLPPAYAAGEAELLTVTYDTAGNNLTVTGSDLSGVAEGEVNGQVTYYDGTNWTFMGVYPVQAAGGTLSGAPFHIDKDKLTGITSANLKIRYTIPSVAFGEWPKVKTYDVTFDAGSKTFDTSFTPDNKNGVVEGTKLSELFPNGPADGVASDSLNVFNKWTVSGTALTEQDYDGDIAVNENLTIKANWYDPITIEKYNNPKNVLSSSKDGEVQAAVNNTTFQLEALAADGHYLFEKWHVGSVSGDEFSAEDQLVPANAGKTIKVYATWTQDAYEIKGNVVKGDSNAQSLSGISVAVTDKNGTPVSGSPFTTSDNGAFDFGWLEEGDYTATIAGKSGEYQETVANFTVSENKADMTITLKALGQVKVTFDANGGKIGTSTTAEQYVLSGTKVTNAPENPTRDDYTFVKWAESKTATAADTDTVDLSAKTFSEDTTLYAVWTPKITSDSPRLVKLDVSGQRKLTPAFDYATTSYKLSVDNSVSSLTFTPEAANGDITQVTFNKSPLTASDGAYKVPALKVGSDNVLEITVSDGTSTSTYKVTVTRKSTADATPTPTTPVVTPSRSYGGGGSTGTAGVNSAAGGGSGSTTPTPSTAPNGGDNSTGGVGGFGDVKSGDYFAAPVLWALNSGVTNGVDEGRFGPEAPCTRAQMVTFLYRAAGSPDAEITDAFKDVSADAYYAKAVSWAVANEITNGKGAKDIFAPDDLMTRAEAVTFLYRALKGQPSGTAASFSDVPANAWFAESVAWAVENGITNGMGDNQFQPNTNVNRAMSVTFLYRAYGNK